MSSPLLTRHQYASNNIFQNYEVYIPPSDPFNASTGEESKDKIWLVHIHGGAWRDPTVRAADFLLPTLSHLLNSSSSSPPPPLSSFPSPSNNTPAYSPSPSPSPRPSLKPLTSKIAGFVSLDYRLSPHASHPQDQSSTPAFFLHEARHPDHICDILTALRALQRTYAFGGRYVIVGHSCGGTLGWQVAMSRRWRGDGVPVGGGGESESESEDVGILWDFDDVQPPMAIVSVCAIYDLPLLVQTHGDVPAYRQFTSAAFGEAEEGRLWGEVSPVRWADYASTWDKGDDDEDGDGAEGTTTKRKKKKKKMVAVLAHSRDDELVDWIQVEQMEKHLRRMQQPNRAGPVPRSGWSGDFQVLALKGRHQEVWQKGEEMARAIHVALDLLDLES